MVFGVTFSEPVQTPTAAPVNLNLSGTATGLLTGINRLSASQYELTVSGISGQGTLSLGINNLPYRLSGQPLSG